MKKVLIIGATGMQGSHIIPLLLKKGYQVDGVSLDDAKSNDKNLRYIKGNAFDINFLQELLKNQYDGIIDFLHDVDVEDFKRKMPLFLQNTKHYIF